jgi:hypothetical protein
MVAFPFLALFIIMKSGLKYIDKAIQFEIGKILKEEDASVNPVKDAEEQLKYSQEQMEALKKDIHKFKNWEVQAMSDIKGFQQKQKLSKDPIEKSLATTALSKVATPKDKDLKTMISNKEEELKNLEDKIKSDTLKLTATKKGITVTTGTGAEEVAESISISPSKSKKGTISLPMMTRTFFTEQDENLSSIEPQLEVPKNKAYLVKFDQNTQAPFQVKFTERGFSIDGTRLSFEAFENALSKNYTITLNNGKGLMLDAIRMQKVLKYKNKWFNGQ